MPAPCQCITAAASLPLAIPRRCGFVWAPGASARIAIQENSMTPKHLLAALAALAFTTPAFAQDAAKGEADFKKCKACHMIAADDGTVIQKGGKTGPNLHGVIGRVVASTDFNYGDSIKAVGAAGTVWDEASLAAYLADPTAWLKAATGDSAARSKMSFKLAKGGADMAAYLASVAPAAQ